MTESPDERLFDTWVGEGVIVGRGLLRWLMLREPFEISNARPLAGFALRGVLRGLRQSTSKSPAPTPPDLAPLRRACGAWDGPSASRALADAIDGVLRVPA